MDQVTKVARQNQEKQRECKQAEHPAEHAGRMTGKTKAN